jgi:hypothetical protein
MAAPAASVQEVCDESKTLDDVLEVHTNHEV